MMKLLYGTSNPAKLKYMKEMLQGLDVEIVGLNEIKIEAEEIDESGNDPLENARIKALAYYKLVKMPVFSCDSGLYIEGIEEERQPGVHVRRVNGNQLKDEEMIEYYSNIAKELGGRVKAKYKNAICFIQDEGRIFESMGDELGSEEFILTSVPHGNRNKGFPLDSISIDEKSGKYYMDIGDEESYEGKVGYGLRKFFIKALNLYRRGE
ncbi:non-canonical purine NTP pyrophosphatase [Clostridium sp. UBA1056]|uniref:non-canonical purine NTP pyrophosphatase n=1 Tax=unclassified Clostridium TaxID=2614128 RepID=UPI003217469C